MPTFANAPAPETGLKFGDLYKDLLAIKPLKEGTHESDAYGVSEYTDARVLRIDPKTGEWENVGTLWIFAQRVRGQLRNGGGWCAGTLTKNGQAYQLDPVPDGQVKLVEAAIEAFDEVADMMSDAQEG